MAKLFGVKVPAINKHLKNIFESGELDRSATVSKMETTASDGKSFDRVVEETKRLERGQEAKPPGSSKGHETDK